MSKKKPSKTTSTRALTGPRVLHKQIPAYNHLYDESIPAFPAQDGWYNEGLANAIAYETYFDLSGYELDDLTFTPTGGTVQTGGRYVAENMPDVDIEVLDIVSTERLSLTDVEADLLLGNVPGMSLSKEDWTQIIFGQYQVMTTNTNYSSLDIMTPIGGGSFGSMEPSAAAKLWVYRIVRINGTKVPTSELRIPAARMVLPGVVSKEDELPYMMRLKRSFELSTNQ